MGGAGDRGHGADHATCCIESAALRPPGGCGAPAGARHAHRRQSPLRARRRPRGLRAAAAARRRSSPSSPAAPSSPAVEAVARCFRPSPRSCSPTAGWALRRRRDPARRRERLLAGIGFAPPSGGVVRPEVARRHPATGAAWTCSRRPTSSRRCSASTASTHPPALPAIAGLDAPELPGHDCGAWLAPTSRRPASSTPSAGRSTATPRTRASTPSAPLSSPALKSPGRRSRCSIRSRTSRPHAALAAPGLLESASFQPRRRRPAGGSWKSATSSGGTPSLAAETEHMALVLGGRDGNPWQRPSSSTSSTPRAPSRGSPRR